MAKRVMLYVEDNPDDVEIMQMSFDRLRVDYALHAVFSGREAIDRLKNKQGFTDRNSHPVPEIILLDLTMPEFDGFEVLKLIKTEADLRSIPVFAISGSKNPEMRQKAIDLGAIGYIQKGWSAASFVETLGYINTRLMAALKYDLILQYHRQHEATPKPPPAD